MKSKPIDWSHLIMLIVLTSLHRCSHAQPGTSTTWAGSTLKDALAKTHFSIIVIAFLSSIVFLIFFSLFIRHCVDTCATTTSHPNTAAAGRRRREAIDKCPVLVYSEVKELRIGNSALECAVCLSEFEDTDKIRLLPKCNHVFHPDCIDKWFASRLTCPVCRAKITLSDCDDNADAVTTESNHDESPVSDAEIIEQQSTEESPEPPPEETIEVDGESGSTGVPAQTETWSRTVAESFARSYSTGHSMIMESEGLIERYTLRLPEHAREEIFGREERNRLRRCASNNDVVLRGEWSLKNGSDNMERWVLQSMTPPFVSNNWSSVKFMRKNTDKSSSSPPPRLPV